MPSCIIMMKIVDVRGCWYPPYRTLFKPSLPSLPSPSLLLFLSSLIFILLARMGIISRAELNLSCSPML